MQPKTVYYEGLLPQNIEILVSYFEVPEEDFIKLHAPIELDGLLYQYLWEETLIYICPAPFFMNAKYNCIVENLPSHNHYYYSIEQFPIGPIANQLRETHKQQSKIINEIKDFFNSKSKNK